MRHITKQDPPRFAVLSVNAGVDRMLYLGAPLAVGDMNRATRTVICPGSKGANVALRLQRLGADVTYIAVTGGDFGVLCNSLTEREGIPCRFVSTAAGVRLNTKLLCPDGTATECNERGGPMTEKEAAALRAALCEVEADVYLLCGSLPQGVTDDFYATVIRDIREKHPHAAVVVDCTGAAMREALRETPDLIKPNRSEIAEIMGTAVPKNAMETALLCRAFSKKHPHVALYCTQGADGAAYFDGDEQIFLPAVRVETPVCTVGAGDTALAAFVHAYFSGSPTREALTRAAKIAAEYVAGGK